MISISIPKDIREYEPKFIANLTAKQCICLLLAAIIEFAGVQIQKLVFHLPTASFIPPLFIAFVPLLFGWGKQIFHMETEVYIRNVLFRSLTVPPKRVYKTRNFYDLYLTKEKEPIQEKKKKKQDSSISPEFRAYD